MKARDKPSSDIPESVAVEPLTDQWFPSETSLSADHLPQTHNRLRALYVLGQDVYQCQSYDDVLSTTLEFLDRLLLPERCILTVQSPEGEVLSSRFKGMQETKFLDKLPISHNLNCSVSSAVM